ncbi:MAG TPA: hypothetical protein VF657_13025 [Actinoplanes sp.]|jgi:hypothetical protein
MSLPLRTRLRRSVALVVLAVTATAGTSVVAATPAQATSTCAVNGSITQGKYWLNNNLWGRGSGSGWQCVWDAYTSGNTIGWGTNYDWTGQSNSVKSYTSAVLGWHWGWKATNTGLPVRLNANRNVNTGWSFNVRHNGGGAMNVAYDLWLHTQSNPTWEHQPSDEIMVWLYRANGAGPVGTRQATVNIAGTNWDLYRGNIGWNVFSFVRTSNTTSATLNLRDFTNNLISRGWVQNTKYLTSVQAGTEIFTGNGQIDTSSYYANVQ